MSSNISQFKVLAADLLDQRVKEQILADLIGVKGNPLSIKLPSNFTIRPIDHYGRVFTISYRGVEVMLLFNRITSELTNLPLEIAPQAYLKNADESWMVIKLLDLYPGISIGEKIDKLEMEVKQKDGLIRSLEFQLEQNDLLLEELSTKKRRKDNKSAPTPAVPVPIASPDVNKYILKIKPVKLQEAVRLMFLWAQGFDVNLVHGHHPQPDVPKKYFKKVSRHLTKLEKILKESKLNRDMGPYLAMPPKALKPKKVVKKKVVKKGKKP